MGARFDAEMSRKDESFADFQAAQQRQKESAIAHHKMMLTQEKGLHEHTMERTMGRVMRHFRCEDSDQRGPDTPTRDHFKRFVHLAPLALQVQHPQVAPSYILSAVGN